jgi:hypothetical protein
MNIGGDDNSHKREPQYADFPRSNCAIQRSSPSCARLTTFPDWGCWRLAEIWSTFAHRELASLDSFPVGRRGQSGAAAPSGKALVADAGPDKQRGLVWCGREEPAPVCHRWATVAWAPLPLILLISALSAKRPLAAQPMGIC